MSLLHSFIIFMFIAIATASAIPQDWSDPGFKPKPAGVTGDMKAIKVNKGCACAAWSTDLCGGSDPMNGIKFWEWAEDGAKSKTFKQDDHVRWYKCQRI
ncbi:hypothetical protein P153DRAFT_383885 [Dothidotthia symphoricarpi CBS 119687]|uniref:Uncharacterized protein n=1 Tax=Dothidotthia symphoricarpi CBS 119687 TaxID=1392245 RepID=A0A6A6AJQ9_9PLEO|nr:uncharacterized protein P153DRAFT_383885 [Dothidotthia symphoricarpi CBS 119687]KAF2131796.1 hypothetical protein P153DRAFT_383885 [Dothidotthia symphoricarpi CBS 119687]